MGADDVVALLVAAGVGLSPRRVDEAVPVEVVVALGVGESDVVAVVEVDVLGPRRFRRAQRFSGSVPLDACIILATKATLQALLLVRTNISQEHL